MKISEKSHGVGMSKEREPASGATEGARRAIAPDHMDFAATVPFTS